ncbi:sorting and assembly machinery component 50 [Anaeramoeba ignava]|uniref:Sorting and assembly machinery component 50 n=1 Tax=Anaeramoeba ignava TaxID=1746090 RepID=A0A9Q0L7W7_ANAIG|nr:sorting and assembly machinery component 50 [Anaeramoeba ignava]
MEEKKLKQQIKVKKVVFSQLDENNLILKHVFNSLQNAKTLKEAIELTKEAFNILKKFYVFRNIKINFRFLENSKRKQTQNCIVEITTIQKRPFPHFSMFPSFKDSNPFFNFQLSVINILNAGIISEKFRFSNNYEELHFGISLPLIEKAKNGKFPQIHVWNSFGSNRNYFENYLKDTFTSKWIYSSDILNHFDPNSFGIGRKNGVSLWSLIFQMRQNNSWENDLSIQNLFRSTYKISLEHGYILDKRNSPQIPTKGWMFSTFNEIAGFSNFGKAHFFRNDSRFQFHIPLGKYFSYNFMSKFNFVIPTKKKKDLIIDDQIFVEDSVPFRGFNYTTLSEDIFSDFDLKKNTSGNVFGLITGTLATNFNLFRRIPLSLFTFGSVGNLGKFRRKDFTFPNLFSFAKRSRMSFGVGIATRFRDYRLEVSYSIPFRLSPQNKPQNFNPLITFDLA